MKLGEVIFNIMLFSVGTYVVCKLGNKKSRENHMMSAELDLSTYVAGVRG